MKRWIKIFLFLSGALFCARAFAERLLIVDSTVDQSCTAIEISAVLDGLDNSLVGYYLNPSNFVKEVRVVINRLQRSDVSYRGSESEEQQNIFWEVAQVPVLFDTSENSSLDEQALYFSLKISVTKQALRDRIKKIIKSEQPIHVQLGMKGSDDSPRFGLVSGEAKPISFLPDDIPQELKFENTHKSVSVEWKLDKVLYSNGKKYEAGQIVFFLIDKDTVEASLVGAELVKSSDTKHGLGEKIERVLEVRDGAASLVDHDEHAKFSFASHQPDDGVRTFVADVQKKQFVISGLEVGKDYYVFAQFENGVQQSPFFKARPIQTVMLTEINGDGEAGPMDPRCFILSATYGSALDQRVDYFRWFRDRVLLSSELGKNFVEFYYEVSPPMASYISQKPLLKETLQFVLYPVLGLLMLCSWCDSCGFPFWAILFIFMSVLLAFLFVRKHHPVGIWR